MSYRFPHIAQKILHKLSTNYWGYRDYNDFGSNFQSYIDMKNTIRQIIKEHGKLSANIDSLEDSSDLYNAGMTSHASVVVMLALENEFDFEFPSELLNRKVFESINSIAETVSNLASTVTR
jgi:acyl carrier protein